MLVFALAIVTLLRLALLRNALSPMLVTVPGIVTAVRAVLKNAPSPMLLTVPGIVTAVRAVLKNATSPILVTPLPRETVANLPFSENAP